MYPNAKYDPMAPKNDDDPGYIIGWRHKRQFTAGRLAEQVMTYGEARQRAEALCAEDPSKTFWAEHLLEAFKPHGA